MQMHLRWHNQRPFRCKGCTCNFQTHKQWIQHRRIEHPVIKSQQKPKLPPIKKTGILHHHSFTDVGSSKIYRSILVVNGHSISVNAKEFEQIDALRTLEGP